MAQPEKAPAKAGPRILAVTCMRSVSFNSALDSRWATGKGFFIEQDAVTGDVRVLAPNGRQLFIPKQLAVLELE